MFFLSPAVEAFPMLGVTVRLSSLGCPPTLLISGPAVGAAQILIWSTPVCLCPQCPQLSELVRFLLWELSKSVHIFHLCMWVVHWGLLLRLPWRTWVCPSEGQVWRCCSSFGLEGYGNKYWLIHSCVHAWRAPLTEKP